MSKETKKKTNIIATRSETTRHYNVLIVVTILVAFLFIALAYSQILYNSLVDDKVKEMNGLADALQTEYQHIENLQMKTEFSSSETLSLNISANLTKTTIWIVKSDGKLSYMSSIPFAARDQIRYRQSSGYYLPETIPVLQDMDTGLTLSGGNFWGVFDESSGEWLSVVRSIHSPEGGYWASLILHYPLSEIQLSNSNILGGIVVMLLIALAVAIVIIRAYVNRMTEPIELLSEAATQVAKGDLSTRVVLPWLDEAPIIGSNTADDDLMNLIRTFNRMIDQVERQNREQRDFVASISHDLRTPLTSINGFITAILDGTIPPELQDKYLTRVHDECVRLSSLVHDMNTAIEFDQSAAKIEFTKFDIHEVIRRVVLNLEVLMSEKNITVQTNFSTTELKTFVLGNEDQIERVLYNLISNAAKFVDDQGIISVNLQKKSKDLVYIEVEDNGPGIPEEDIPYIFNRFFKSDRTRGERQGSGLGLFICNKILQAHGQKIYAGHSSLGGAKFDFTLPLA